MTNTYLIQAWCIRPFITTCDVETETPEQAIAIARNRQDQLLDAAEECNGAYPWDEFAAYDENGRELLHVLDDQARLRDASPELLEALETLLAAIDGLPITILNGPAYHALNKADAAIAKAKRHK